MTFGIEIALIGLVAFGLGAAFLTFVIHETNKSLEKIKVYYNPKNNRIKTQKKVNDDTYIGDL